VNLLDVREYSNTATVVSAPDVELDSITVLGENSPPDLHDTMRRYYEEPLRWESRVYHD
jgi:hypothetical protein